MYLKFACELDRGNCVFATGNDMLEYGEDFATCLGGDGVSGAEGMGIGRINGKLKVIAATKYDEDEDGKDIIYEATSEDYDGESIAELHFIALDMGICGFGRDGETFSKVITKKAQQWVDMMCVPEAFVADHFSFCATDILKKGFPLAMKDSDNSLDTYLGLKYVQEYIRKPYIVQITDVWTNPEWEGEGICTYILSHIYELLKHFANIETVMVFGYSELREETEDMDEDERIAVDVENMNISTARHSLIISKYVQFKVTDLVMGFAKFVFDKEHYENY